MTSQDLPGMSDAALVVAIGRWNQGALAEAYRRHGGAVYGLAHRVLGDGENARDIVQEVFLRLWNQPERFDPGRSPACSARPKAPSRAASARGSAACGSP